MNKTKEIVTISKNQLQRLPFYLNYLKIKRQDGVVNISSPMIANELDLNEEQVRKDIALISSKGGKPKSGRLVEDLINDIEKFLGYRDCHSAVLVGVGHLGTALLSYDGFANYGLEIVGAFDNDEKLLNTAINGKKIFSMNKLENLCQRLNIHIGIITVPVAFAQEVANQLTAAGVKAIWNFAPIHLNVSSDVIVLNENMASSLAVLSRRLNESYKN